MKLDVCVPVLEPASPEFESMIRREIPVNRILYSFAKPIGTARQELIDQVETEFFVFIDSDIELSRRWFAKTFFWFKILEPHMKIGGVEGLWSNPDAPEIDAYRKSMNRLATYLHMKIRPPSEIGRGFCGDVIIRTDLVKDIRIPPIPLYEDDLIKQHIARKGYHWFRTPEVVCVSPQEGEHEDGVRHGILRSYLRRFDHEKRAQEPRDNPAESPVRVGRFAHALHTPSRGREGAPHEYRLSRRMSEVDMKI